MDCRFAIGDSTGKESLPRKIGGRRLTVLHNSNSETARVGLGMHLLGSVNAARKGDASRRCLEEG
jgi:hypothetical protein